MFDDSSRGLRSQFPASPPRHPSTTVLTRTGPETPGADDWREHGIGIKRRHQTPHGSKFIATPECTVRMAEVQAPPTAAETIVSAPITWTARAVGHPGPQHRAAAAASATPNDSAETNRSAGSLARPCMTTAASGG